LLETTRKKVLRRFLTAQSLSVVGTSVSKTALSILLEQMSGGTALTGLVLAVTSAPTLVLTPLLGVWAERAQPRSLVGLNLLLSIASVVLAFGMATKNIPVICLALVAAQAIDAGFNPVYNRILGALMPQGQAAADDVGQLQGVLSRIATTLGSGSAPWLITLVGPLVFLLDAGSFIVSASIAKTFPNLPSTSSEAIVPSGQSALTRVKGVFASAKEGWGMVDKGLLLLLASGFAVWTAETAVLPALPAAKPILGFLLAAKPVSEFFTVLVMKFTKIRYTNKTLFWGGVALGFSAIVLASSVWFGKPAAVIGIILSGIGSNIVGTGANVRLYFKERSAAARVAASVTVASKVAEILFVIVAGFSADIFGRSVPFTIAGVLMLSATLVVFGIFKPVMAEAEEDLE
jgi:MFS family permease